MHPVRMHVAPMTESLLSINWLSNKFGLLHTTCSISYSSPSFELRIPSYLELQLCFHPEVTKPCDVQCREYYTLDHLRRLKQFEAQASYNEGKCSDYCKEYHVQPCRACTTCHFCRYGYMPLLLASSYGPNHPDALCNLSYIEYTALLLDLQ